MHFFDKMRPRLPISVRELKEVGRQVEQTYPLGIQGTNRGIRQIAGGTAIQDIVDDERKLGVITFKKFGSPGDPIKYGITEKWLIPSTGALEDLPTPIKFDGTDVWAIAIGGIEYAEGDIVEFQRSKRHPDVWEIKKGGGASIIPNCYNINFTTYSYTCNSGSLVQTPIDNNIPICIKADGTLTGSL
jgi:hypothetical protein